MTDIMPSTLVRKIRDRQILLWVCQRYDLALDAEPHDYDLPPTEAALIYRSEMNAADRAIAARYWEAVWLEGAQSPLLTAMRRTADKQVTEHLRPVVVLAGQADAEAQVSTQEFLPVSVLPGLLDSPVPDAQYGMMRKRVREHVAQKLATRLSKYPGRLVVVLGVRNENDLQTFLYPILEDYPIPDLDILIVWPSDAAPPPPPENVAVHLHPWQNTVEQLIDVLTHAGAPAAGDAPLWRVRLGKQTVQLSARDVHRVLEKFVLITEQDLLPPQEFGMEDLQDFLAGNLKNWKGYAAGLPVPRSYTSAKNCSLSDELFAALKEVEQENSPTRTFGIQLPCEGGAGTTTLLRAAAFQAAREGYPTLILGPEQVDLDVEELIAFATALSEAALAQEIKDMPPLLIILDTEHTAIRGLGHLAQTLAVHGRPAVLLQAVPYDDEQVSDEKRSPRWARLHPLQAKTSPEEVEYCAERFQKVIKRWDLELDIPSLAQWRDYERAMRWTTPAGDGPAPSLFWVALRFFLTEHSNMTAAEYTKDALGLWIEKRVSRVTDPDMQGVLQSIAVLSAWRILSPLTTVLRPVTHGTFSSELVGVMRQLADVVVWGAFSEDLQDYTLHFTHPALAEEYLRKRSIHEPKQRMEVLSSMLLALSAGHPGDIWIAESLVTRVLTPAFEERGYADWGWRLDTFSKLPPVIRDQHKTVLHHWARCLYLAAEPRNSPDLSPDERSSQFKAAIDKLRKAIALPHRRQREEHPSHLYNTLGVACSRYANFLESTDPTVAAAVWNAACDAFQKAIDLLPGNVDALLAFSRRLLLHAKVNDANSRQVTDSQVNETARALNLLDEAEKLLDEMETLDPSLREDLSIHRTMALAWFSTDAARAYVRDLREKTDPELGYYCEAHLALHDRGGTQEGLEQALQVFNEAEAHGVSLKARSLAFRLSLLQRHSQERYNYALLLRLYQELEGMRGSMLHPVDAFRHAVICYQTGRFREGEERFRRLREQRRRSESPAFNRRDYWWDAEDPTQPRHTQIRVTRWITEWRAEGYIDDLQQTVPLRPRHFNPPPRVREIVPCIVRFELNGPLAVPPRFVEGGGHRARRPSPVAS